MRALGPVVRFRVQEFRVSLPKTTCLPSSHAVCAVQRKNWEPLVPGPALALA